MKKQDLQRSPSYTSLFVETTDQRLEAEDIVSTMRIRQSRCILVELSNKPPLIDVCFTLLKKSGAAYFALFGGAIRDADYGKRYHKKYDIKDYDLRVWFEDNDYEKQIETFITKLELNTDLIVTQISSPGTGKIRYCLNYAGVEFDISIRPIPTSYQNGPISEEAVAIDRASDSDAGISSIAIDSLGRAWGTPEYVDDISNKTITIYPCSNVERKRSYMERMKNKFPEHEVIELESIQSTSAATQVCF